MQFLKQVISMVQKREKERKYKCGFSVCVFVEGVLKLLRLTQTN